MPLPISGQVGPTAFVAADGSSLEVRQGRTGDIIVSELLPRYGEMSARGLAFNAANQAAQAISVALTTTYTGLCLFNPPQSGVLVMPTKLKFALTVAPAAISSIGLIQGFSATGGVTAQTTPLTPMSNMIGAPRGRAIALSAATIVTPTWLMQLVDGFTAGSLPAPSAVVDLEGTFTIPPGGFIAFGALTAVTGLGSMAWIEVPATNP